MPQPMGPRMFVARRTFEEWQRQATVFSSLAAFVSRSLNETSSGHPRHVDTGFASATLFPMLGAEPRFGRLFTAADEKPGNDHAVLLTDAFFDRHCQRNPTCIGRSLTLDGVAHTIIGVLPPRFHLPATHQGGDQVRPEVWVPLSRLPAEPVANQPTGMSGSGERVLRVAARLKPQMPGLAQVIPMPRVIPMPQFSERVGPDADPDAGPDRPEPDTAA